MGNLGVRRPAVGCIAWLGRVMHPPRDFMANLANRDSWLMSSAVPVADENRSLMRESQAFTVAVSPRRLAMLSCTSCVTTSLSSGAYEADLDATVCCSSCSDALLLSARVLFSSKENSAFDALAGLWGKLSANASKSNFMFVRLAFAAARSKNFVNMAWRSRPNETELSYRWRERAWIAMDVFSIM